MFRVALVGIPMAHLRKRVTSFSSLIKSKAQRLCTICQSLPLKNLSTLSPEYGDYSNQWLLEWDMEHTTALTWQRNLKLELNFVGKYFSMEEVNAMKAALRPTSKQVAVNDQTVAGNCYGITLFCEYVRCVTWWQHQATTTSSHHFTQPPSKSCLNYKVSWIVSKSAQSTKTKSFSQTGASGFVLRFAAQFRSDLNLSFSLSLLSIEKSFSIVFWFCW